MAAVVLLLKVALVFGLLALVLWVLKRTDGLGMSGGGRSRAGLLEVRGSTRLGKGATLTVVRMDGKDLLLGVTDHTVTLLTADASPEAPGPKTDIPPAALAAALASLRGEPPATDGTAAVSTRLAVRRRVARTDALRDEEHPWTRACRPAFRDADGDDALG